MMRSNNIIFIFGKNIHMVEIEIFPIYGCILGVNYSNEDLELLEVVADDKRHTIQIFLLLIGISFHYYTMR